MARDEIDRMMCAEWGLKHEPILPYDPTVFNPCDVIQSIADENDLDAKTAAEVHEWLVVNDPDQLEPLAPIADEGETIPVPDPDVVKFAVRALRDPHAVTNKRKKVVREKYGQLPDKAERLFRQLRAKHKDKSDTEIMAMVEQQLR